MDAILGATVSHTAAEELILLAATTVLQLQRNQFHCVVSGRKRFR